MDIQTAAHQKASLLPSPSAVVHLLQNRLLQLFGNVEQVTGNLLVLLFQIVIHLGYPMNLHTDAFMDIPVGNALGQFGQFLSSLPLQLLADAALSDFFQDPLDIGRGTGVSGPFVVVIPFHCATLRRGERRGVGQGDTSILLLSYGLAGTRRGLPFHRQPFFFRGSRRSGRSFLHGIFFLLAAIGRSVRFRFFLLLGCIGGQLCGSGTDTCSRGTPVGAGRRAAGDWLRFTSSLSAVASQSRK